MTIDDLLSWYESLNSEKMPRYIKLLDANNNQVNYDGKWQNIPYIWSVFNNGMSWTYVETDSERGYVVDIKYFENEKSAVNYAHEVLNKKYLALSGNSKEEMLCRYVMRQYGYSEKRTKIMIDRMMQYNDIFEEFFNYARIGKFQKKDKSKTEVCGYTAEKLNRDFNLSPLGAYNYLVYLKEEPQQAVADLKAGLPRK